MPSDIYAGEGDSETFRGGAGQASMLLHLVWSWPYGEKTKTPHIYGTEH